MDSSEKVLVTMDSLGKQLLKSIVQIGHGVELILIFYAWCPAQLTHTLTNPESLILPFTSKEHN